MQKLVVIRNAAAGSADSAAGTAALDVLAAETDVVIATLDSPAEIAGVLAEHRDREPVVLGGDGSLHALVAALRDRGELADRPVGLIPLGTGNDFARTLGIPLDPEAAARVVLRRHRRTLDLLHDSRGGIVVNAAHLGVGAEASRRAAPLKPWLRRFAYTAGSVVAGLRTPGWHLRVRVDDETVADGERRVLMVGIGTGATIGGGTPLLPDAEPDDGTVHVMVSFATGPLSRLAYAKHLRDGSHPARRDVVHRQGATVTVDGDPVPVNADGELDGPYSHHEWRLHARAWRITVPPPDRSGGRTPGGRPDGTADTS
ncbi:MAG TPA: diacylglycerol kinase family protein [Streptosporangiaceae bacterium]|nr:diacylglycerol kinase family protein [Streptosporangiaceae bacterium]